MTLHQPNPAAPRKPKPPRRDPRPITLGDVLGEQIRQVQAERARRAELDAAGFKPLTGAP